MKKLAPIAVIVFWLGACGGKTSQAPIVESELASGDVRSGSAFLTAETRALQDDDFANPGYLWVDRGAALFDAAEGVAKPCRACHASGLPGAAATFPKIAPETGELVNLEGRINLCRSQHQGLDPLTYESEALLSLTAWLASQSKGFPIEVSADGDLQENYRNGQSYFFTRRGQMNLSCHQCHDLNWGKKLRGDTLSQGHLNGFPAYRLEWQALGSSHRRLRDCDIGVRAEPLPFGDPTYIDLELYLAVRSTGLVGESPGVRR